jgi:drug/metabolite transporter (DMT)-like permease
MSSIKHGRYNRPFVAIGLCLTSMTFFSVQDAMVKWLATDYWLVQLLFMRSIVIVIVVGMYIAFNQGLRGFKTYHPGHHLLRTSFNFFAFLTYYLAITQMPLAHATSIGLTAPLFMTALSGPLLGEPVGILRKLILSTGFIGVIIIIQPTADDFNLTGSLYALAGALLFALLAIQTRKMSKNESSELMVFYAALAFLIVTGIFMIFHWVTPDPKSMVLMLTLGLITVFAQYTIVHAYQYARIHIIAPFEYITVLWAVLIGWFVFSEQPTWTMYTGASLVILAGLVICWYEKVEYDRNTTPPIHPV